MQQTQTMKVDTYTKIVLTTIALALVGLVFRDIPIIPSLQAAPPVDRGDQVVKVQIVSIDESNTLRWEALPVKIEE
jgi:hypothetical protein